MRHREKSNAAWRQDGAFFDAGGSATVEFALVAPFLILLALGIADFSTLFNDYQALAAATRIGAEYARNSTTCQSGINTVASPPTVSAACITGIQDAIANSIYFSPAPTFPASFGTLRCECESTSPPSANPPPCAGPANFDSCFANPPAGGTGPNRVFITVSANQSFAPLTPWPAVTLQTITELRIQ